MLFFENKRVLILAPHTDDGEFGCGGSIAYMVDHGADVFYAAFSACKQSVLPQYPSDILVKEVKNATTVLGIKCNNLLLFDYEVRSFNYRRQEILDDILTLKRDVRPEIVIVPSQNDIHQDHYTISQEAVRAFKFSTILCYELPWNTFNFQTCCFIPLEEKYISMKIQALRKYESQAHRPYSNENFIRGLALTRGVQCGEEMAEVFEVVRWIIR